VLISTRSPITQSGGWGWGRVKGWANVRILDKL
jgi:hypothetical protein